MCQANHINNVIIKSGACAFPCFNANPFAHIFYSPWLIKSRVDSLTHLSTNLWQQISGRINIAQTVLTWMHIISLHTCQAFFFTIIVITVCGNNIRRATKIKYDKIAFTPQWTRRIQEKNSYKTSLKIKTNKHNIHKKWQLIISLDNRLLKYAPKYVRFVRTYKIVLNARISTHNKRTFCVCARLSSCLKKANFFTVRYRRR